MDFNKYLYLHGYFCFILKVGDAVKEIYHSAFMQHVVFGIPMQDVQNQKTLYKPGAPPKVQGHQEGHNF